MLAIWRNSHFRGWIVQVIVLMMFSYFCWSLWDNLQTNLANRGIATGFAFLDTEAGFGIISHLVEYSEASSYGRAFLVGLLNTLLVSFVGIILATVLGVIVGVARLSSNWLVSRLALSYIEIIRNIPLLLQIFFWYFVVLRNLPSPRQSINWWDMVFLNNRGIYLPEIIPKSGFELVGWGILIALVIVIFLFRWSSARQHRTGKIFPIWKVSAGLLIGLPSLIIIIQTLFMQGLPFSWELPALRGFNFKGGVTIIPEFMALLMALSIYTASYIAEIVRSGIEAVDKGQTEAARSLGLSNVQILNLVVLPQALRVIIPPLTNQYLNLLKNSSLAAAIAYPDLVSVFAGTVLNQTGQAVEVIGITMGVYLLISLSISIFMNWYNHKVRIIER